jgi:hypothetical protein
MIPGNAAAQGEPATTGFVPRTALRRTSCLQEQGVQSHAVRGRGGLIRFRQCLTTLTGGFFFGVARLTTVFGRLLLIPGLLPRHVAGIEMILAIRIFAQLLLIRVLAVVVGHEAHSFRERNNVQQDRTPIVPIGGLFFRLAYFGQHRVGKCCP